MSMPKTVLSQETSLYMSLDSWWERELEKTEGLIIYVHFLNCRNDSLGSAGEGIVMQDVGKKEASTLERCAWGGRGNFSVKNGLKKVKVKMRHESKGRS